MDRSRRAANPARRQRPAAGRRLTLLVACGVLLLTGGAAGAGGSGGSHRIPAGAPRAPAAASLLVAEGVWYARGHALDVYRPRQLPPLPPVVVMLHACCGDRSDLGKLAEAVAAGGAVVFNADWSGIDADARYPAAYEDAACAVRFARVAAARYGADPRKVVLLGWSDGALVASVVALAGDRLDRTRCREPAASATPDALVGVGGYYGWRLPVPPAVVNPRTVRFFGGTPTTAAQAWRAATPYAWLPGPCPFRTTLLAGSTDPLRADAMRFAVALRHECRYVRLVIAPPAGDPSMISPRTAEGQTTIRETLTAGDNR